MTGKRLDAQKRSREFYEEKWLNIILPQLRAWADVGVELSKGAKEELWVAYCAFNEHCSDNYLGGLNSTLDRHKVAGCYLCAILAARPLRASEAFAPSSEAHFANEYAAIHVACSVLAGFTMAAIDGAELSEGEKARAREAVLSGLHFDEVFPAGHETYLISAIKALRFTAAERRYNLLLISLLMYHWEQALVGDAELFEKIVAVRDKV